jgi:hypothetical protein
MALGKLWQVFFGKRSESVAPAEAARAIPSVPETPNASLSIANDPSGSMTARPVVGAPIVASADASLPKQPSGFGRPKRSAVKRSAKSNAAPEPVLSIAPVMAVRDSRPARPKKNGWTPWLTGRTVLSVLDTQPGDGARAVEILEALVCVSNPMPKYAAIGSFELATGGLSVLKFHRMIRAAGGHAVPIPGGLTDGLRHLSQTYGTVDLILLDGAEADWERPDVRRWIERVAHAETTILRRTAEGRWVAIERPKAMVGPRVRKAA